MLPCFITFLECRRGRAMASCFSTFGSRPLSSPCGVTSCSPTWWLAHWSPTPNDIRVRMEQTWMLIITWIIILQFGVESLINLWSTIRQGWIIPFCMMRTLTTKAESFINKYQWTGKWYRVRLKRRLSLWFQVTVLRPMYWICSSWKSRLILIDTTRARFSDYSLFSQNVVSSPVTVIT